MLAAPTDAMEQST